MQTTITLNGQQYQFKITLRGRITVNGDLVLTHYHVFEPVNPIPHQSNAFIPVKSPYAAFDSSSAQDCYGRRFI